MKIVYCQIENINYLNMLKKLERYQYIINIIFVLKSATVHICTYTLLYKDQGQSFRLSGATSKNLIYVFLNIHGLRCLLFI